MVFTKKFLLLLVFALLLTHGIAVWYSLYPKIGLLDITLHFFGGAAIVIFVVLYFGHNFNTSKSKLFIVLSLIAWAVFAGVLWELFEWGFDYFIATPYSLHYMQPGLADTMGDLAMDIFGGAAVAFMYVYKLRKSDARNNK